MNQAPSRSWQKQLSYAFRSRGFLWKFAIGVMLAGTAIGYVASTLQPPPYARLGERALALSGIPLDLNADEEDHPRESRKSADLADAFIEETARTDADFIEFLLAVPLVAHDLPTEKHEAIHEALRKKFSAEEAELGFDYLLAWNSAEQIAFARLKATADRPNAPRFANYAAGCIELRRKNHHDAYLRFLKEGERPEAHESRALAVRALVEGKDFAALNTLTKDPHYRRYITPYISLEAAIAQKNWGEILRQSPLCQIESYKTASLIVTIIAGIAWAFFLGHLGEIPGVFSKTAGLCLLAFIAGVISTIPTVYLVILEEKIHHFAAGRDIPQLLAFYIGGVGVREELCKLLLFVPLLPFLLRRNDELEALLVASFVGLGFAIEENTDYFMSSEAISAPARFLTANFLHVALTGVNGLALFRACTRKVNGLNEFLFIFPVTILVHGLYDALPDFPASDVSGYAGMVLYVVFSTYYFSRIHPLRNNVRTTFGLTGAFVVSVSFLAAATIAYAMVMLGPKPGFIAIFPELIGSAILLFMFFREFNEALSE